MLLNCYWRISGKEKLAGSDLIVELTLDGMAYIWPAVAAKQLLSLPPEEDQDFDALLIDGDYLDSIGYFNSISDFMTHSKYTYDRYEFTPLGEYDSIRSCRSVFGAALGT